MSVKTSSSIQNEPISERVKLQEKQDSWKQLAKWIHCIAVVTFDLELGQVFEYCFAPCVPLSDEEKANICYLAFPDSNSGCMGDTHHYFRIRKASSNCHINSKSLLNINCPSILLEDLTHYYGFVHFRQVSDETVRRGYFQKSVVILSSFPYFSFFKKIVEIIAIHYFQSGISSIQKACQDINEWPSPLSGQLLNLLLLGISVDVHIPTNTENLSCIKTSGNEKSGVFPDSRFLSLNNVSFFQCLHEVLPQVQLLWELVLLGEPIVVFAPSPNICSSTVLALTSLIQPLRYHCDFRPYFTIHDSEFKEFTNHSKNIPHVILGVTNPYFATALRSWPHSIKVGHSEESLRRFSLSSSIASRKNKHMEVLNPGIYTKYKPFLKKDNKFIKAALKGLMTSKQQGNVLVKRYFLELTQSFIIPLERYVASLMPLQKFISPLKAPPSLRPFVIDDFIKSVEANGPRLTSGIKGNWIGLYQEFLRGNNFEHWFRRRRREMRAKILSLHLTLLSEMDLATWCSNKTEVEIVDMVLRLRKKIEFMMERQLEVPTGTIERLNVQITTIIKNLPSDMQDILIKNKTVVSL